MIEPIIATENHEPLLFDIINGTWSNRLHDKFKSNSNCSILDLGARFPLDLILSIHEFGKIYTKGVDINSEYESSLEYINWLSLYEDPKLRYLGNSMNNLETCRDFYNIYNFLYTKKEISNTYRKLTKNEFYNTILVNYDFNINVETFLLNNKILFDFIICKNILHFIPEGHFLIELIKNSCKKDGHVFIRIENNTDAVINNFNREKFIEILNENFSNGTLIQINNKIDWGILVFYNFEIDSE